MNAPVCITRRRFLIAAASALGTAAFASATPAFGVPSAQQGSNVALGKTQITTNGSLRSPGQPLSALTNGNTQPSDYVALSEGPVFVQLDLGATYAVSQIRTWHYWGDQSPFRVYHDVIFQVSESGSTWATLFNNDADNSSGQGVGRDAEYEETYLGKTITLSPPMRVRYVRSWTNGSTANRNNHHVELEVTGTATPTATSTPSPTATVTPTPTLTPVPAGRDPYLWPFAVDSSWNRPLGSGTQFSGSGDPRTAALTDPNLAMWVNSSQWGRPTYLAKTTDPEVGLYQGGVLKARIRIPTSAQPSLPAYPNGDASIFIVSPDHRTVTEMWHARRRSDGGFDADAIYVGNDLYGSGWGSAPGQHIGVPAAGCSGMGGTLRTGEIKNGIHHALAAALPYSKLMRGPVWPATSQDSSSSNYAGSVPIGTLVAIPRDSVPTATVNALSSEGRALYDALVQYGMYIIDTTGNSQSFSLSAEPAVAGELGSASSDLERLSPYFRAVTNNTAGSGPVGGGTAVAPFAPPLS